MEEGGSVAHFMRSTATVPARFLSFFIRQAGFFVCLQNCPARRAGTTSVARNKHHNPDNRCIQKNRYIRNICWYLTVVIYRS